ncbi:thiolase family protein [Desulfurella sp.]|uniref:thiolase family protein n=1 Tax=Desulfurella sp. TaxID=1962857 RepID=UPI0025C2CE14|nr:thiolase family protein [Desulfurella sp.]
MKYTHLKKLRDKYAIVGVGYTPQGKVPGRSALSFYVEAGINAIKDAGLKKEDIDGLICYRQFPAISNEPEATPYLVAQLLGIEPTILSQESYCPRHHFVQAVSLLEAGFCNYVLIIYADNALSGRRMFIEEATHPEPKNDNYLYGEFGFVGDYALAARRAMFEFETGPNTWKEIAVSQRKWANLNPNATMYNKPLTYEDYLNSEYLIEPFRKLDASLISDGGRACIVTSVERAKDLKNPVVSIMGIGEANPSIDIHQATYITGPTGAKKASQMAFEMADITLNDIDACEIYDCFTYTVEITMQDYGFFKPGEGKDFFKDGFTAPGGKLPVNTSGGLLSEAYFMGLTPITEAVMQLMGRAEKRQLGVAIGNKKPEIILCSDNGGVLQTHSTIILRRM